MTVFIGTTPNADFIYMPDPGCTNEPVLFNLMELPGASYTWTFGDGGSSTLPDPAHDYDSAGVFNVVVTTMLGSCGDTATQTIEVFDPTVARIESSDSASCGPSDLLFWNSGTTSGTQHTWFLNGTVVSGLDSTAISFSMTGSNLVVLDVQDTATFCSSRDTVQIDIFPVPDASIQTAPDTFACAGATLTYSPVSLTVGSISWLFHDSLTVAGPLANYTYTEPGTYWVRAVRSSAECSDTAYQTVLIHANPVAGFTRDTACAGQPLTLIDTSMAGEPDDWIATWAWNAPPAGSSTDSMPTFLFPVAGDYVISLVVTNNDGCQDGTVDTITVNPTPEADFDWLPKNPCEFEEVLLTDISPGSVTSRFWSIYGLPFVPGDSSISFPIVGAGLAQAMYVEGLNGCYDTATYNMPVREKPKPDFDYLLVCEDAVTEFEYTGITPSDSVSSIYWDFGDGNASGDFEPDYDFQAPGMYEVSLTIVNTNGCDSTVTLPVEVLERPKAQLTSTDTICLGQTIAFDASESTNAEWYTWHMDDGTTPFTTSDSIIDYTFLELGNYDVYLNVEGYGCQADTFHEVWVVQGDITAYFETPDTLPLNIYDTIFNLSTSTEGITDWYWTINGTDTSYDYNLIYIFQTEGEREICLSVRSSIDCIDTYCDEGLVLSSSEAFVTIPNGFTPNGDGRNDYFRPIVHTIIVEFIDFEVYNKWGELLYYSSNPFPGWDGSYKGQPQDTDAYFFVARYELRGEVIQKQGVVHLIR